MIKLENKIDDEAKYGIINMKPASCIGSLSEPERQSGLWNETRDVKCTMTKPGVIRGSRLEPREVLLGSSKDYGLSLKPQR